MAARLFGFMIGITLIIPEATSRGSHGHFPLENCVHDMDMLFLMDNVEYEYWKYSYSSVISEFASEITMLSSSMNRSQLLVAQVLDHFTSHNVSIDVGDWSFETFKPYKEPYQNLSISTLHTTDNQVYTVLEKKIHFVERLFNEMSGVRDTSTHVGVIFLDGYSLTQKDIRNVSSILQQRNSYDVKIFVTVFGNTPAYLTDVIVLQYQDISGQILMMAMCKHCLLNWVLFAHTIGSQSLSCYTLNFNKNKRSWESAHDRFNLDNSQFAEIETTEEMNFLQKYIYGFIKYDSRLSNYGRRNATIYIGLRRDVSNYAKRFRWFSSTARYHLQAQSRPMIISHWLPGKPSPGYRLNCAMWRFKYILNTDLTDNNKSQPDSSDNDFVDGWEDINCDSEITQLSLYEFKLPQKVDHVDCISINPASRESFETALRKGDFVTFQGNIVSVSENVANTEFLKFLKTNNKDFPVFDCGEDAGQQRYIPYSFVCDFIDHCSNKRDEAYCLKQEWNCRSGHSLLHYSMWCDNVKDCPDGSDEEFCVYRRCVSVRCCDGSCLPLQWVNDGEFDCMVCQENSCPLSDEISAENNSSKNDTNCALICNTDSCVSVSQLNDGIIDCIGPEGPLDERIGKLEPANTCKNSVGRIWGPKCVYVVDRYGGTIGCRDMSHLRDCEHFQCREGYVKCPKSYCIPQHYLLDGKADCPTGEDEHPFYIVPCTGNFACWDSKICLHPDLVCDGHADCPNKDDELGCQTCPQGFRCTGGTVTVSGYNTSYPLDVMNATMDKRTTYLDFSGLGFPTLKTFILFCTEELTNVKVLILSRSNITTLNLRPNQFSSGLDPPYMITKLDVSYNMLSEIFIIPGEENTFNNINYLNVSFNEYLVSVKHLKFKYLEIIDLSHTGLSNLDTSVFAGLPMLKHLNLSHTLIANFSRSYFLASFTIQTLDLRGILNADVHSFIFHDLTVSQNLYVDNDQICCPQIRGSKTPAHACQAPVDAISSCFDMIKLPVQRVLLWVVAVLAVLGNMVVIAYRVIWDRSVLNTGYGLFVTNLGVSDFIMGVYMFIVAGADYLYRDIYVLNEMKWKQCVVCKLAGFMATLSSESSTFFIFLITLDRFLVIKFPFGEMKLSNISKIVSVVLSWFTSFSLALIPVVFNLDIYSTNAMCLGLPLTNTRAKGWEYSVGVFICFNLFMFFSIACGQRAMFRAMSENRISKTATSMSCSRRAEDITVAKQLSFIVLSDFLCWFPVGLMGLLSLGGHEVSSEVYAWTTVLLLPINSAVNPVLYTIPALMKSWEKFKYGGQRTRSAPV